LGPAEAAASRIAELKRRVKAAGQPVIYVNDNFGKWRSDFRQLVERCTEGGCGSRKLTERLMPHDDDYFVLKPKHSGFYATPLELLLRVLGTHRLIITGIAGNSCVWHTAADAYMRDFKLLVPEDCTASMTQDANAMALRHMATMLKADIGPSLDIKLAAPGPRS
jgi:nicotinamidase-related amidase